MAQCAHGARAIRSNRGKQDRVDAILREQPGQVLCIRLHRPNGSGAHNAPAGFPPGALDWEEYIGALEEAAYHGFLTIWPDPHGDQASQFEAVKARLDRF